VALSGDGGDENFAGYTRYKADLQENRVRLLLPLRMRKALFGPLGSIYPKMDWAPRFLRAKTTFQSLSFDPVQGYFETMSTFRSHEKPSILSEDIKRDLGGYDSVNVFREHYQNGGNDPLSRIQYVDIKTYLTDDILTKVDRASMANSLEVRCPLLDHRVMELVASIPPSFKLRGMTGKYIFKKVMEEYLPPTIIHRNKMGFGIPLPFWFRNGIQEFARTYLLEKQDSLLSPSFVRKIWNQHQSGIRDRSGQLWNILMFRLWMEKYPA
jgi:asparagine synthase (glutamine-hydrolysing)